MTILTKDWTNIDLCNGPQCVHLSADRHVAAVLRDEHGRHRRRAHLARPLVPLRAQDEVQIRRKSGKASLSSLLRIVTDPNVTNLTTEQAPHKCVATLYH